MGIVRDEKRVYVLSEHTLIGRSPAADLVLEHQQVSSQHAVIYFGEGDWILKDLGSRNGTYLNKRRVEPQVRELLRLGDTISFGSHASTLSLCDDAPPAASARRMDTGDIITADLGLLVLSEQQGFVTILRDAGSWWLEQNERRTAVHNRQVVTIDGVQWELCLPRDLPLDERTESVAGYCELRDTNLNFAVSSDQEHVHITIDSQMGVLSLPPRTFGTLLLYLARARLRDSSFSDVAESEQGWVYADDLMNDLGIAAGRLNVDIFRARKLFEAAKLTNADEIIQRRASTRQVRLGTARVRITEA